jgi:hypothetical protein
MPWTCPRRGAALTALGLLTLAGCGGNPSLGPVEGTLRMNGKPLANVQVEFLPEANGPRSTGVTDQDGHYTLTSNDQKPGAAVGSHRVLLYDLQVYDDKPVGRVKKDQDVTPVRPSRIPTQYANPALTPLKKEVSKEPNTIDLEVKGS